MRSLLVLLTISLLLPISRAHAQAVADEAIYADEAVTTIYWQDAGDVIGDVAYVCGKVIEVRDIGALTFINFDEERPAKFVAVVFDDNYGKFPNKIKQLYEGKLVKVRGQVTTHRDKPQIVVTSPDQIEVIDELPPQVKPKKRAREAGDNQLAIATFNLLTFLTKSTARTLLTRPRLRTARAT